jgi:hypothetical protein
VSTWEEILIGVGAVVGAGACAVIGVLAWFGWRMSNRGPF